MEILNSKKDNLGHTQQTFKLFEFKEKKSKAPHELASIVDQIGEVTEFTKKYSYEFWLRKVKRSKLNYNEILNLVENAKKMDSKYNKGGWLNNKI